MNIESDETPSPLWLAAARAALDEQTQSLDAATLSRLNQARQRALDQGLAKPRKRWQWQWPALVLASACALMLALSLNLQQAEVITPVPLATEPLTEPDYEMLVAGEDLELIEDLEFYAWLDQQALDG